MKTLFLTAIFLAGVALAQDTLPLISDQSANLPAIASLASRMNAMDAHNRFIQQRLTRLELAVLLAIVFNLITLIGLCLVLARSRSSRPVAVSTISTQ